MVPAWLLVKKPAGNDVLIYCTLGSHGSWNPGTGCYENCRPSIELMVEETGLSRSTIKRSLSNLLKLGAVERTPQFTEEGDPAPSLYRVIFGSVVEPAAQQGVGSQTDRPPAAGKTDRSKGGRSTGDPTSVHGRTEGRSTGDPRVGPLVDHNQEPLNQEPKNQSSEPASQSRRVDSEDGAGLPDGQITIDGDVEPPPADREITDKDLANEIARVWIDYWANRKKTPIGGRSPHVLQSTMASSVLGFLNRGYSSDEIGKALNLIGEPTIPSNDRLQRALAFGRGHRPPAQPGRSTAGARVNDHWRQREQQPVGAGVVAAPRAERIETEGGDW